MGALAFLCYILWRRVLKLPQCFSWMTARNVEVTTRWQRIENLAIHTAPGFLGIRARYSAAGWPETWVCSPGLQHPDRFDKTFQLDFTPSPSVVLLYSSENDFTISVESLCLLFTQFFSLKMGTLFDSWRGDFPPRAFALLFSGLLNTFWSNEIQFYG